MVISIFAAHVWSVLQLIILGSFARTIRIRTVYAAMAVGLYLCVPLTAALQVGWTSLFAPLLGMPTPELVRIASYTLDPFVEELMKLLPLTLLLMIPMFRRQWSFTDFVLIGAATGAGFGLAEELYRFGAAAHKAQSIAGGWAMLYPQGYLVVPGIGRILTSWLPTGVSALEDTSPRDLHLVWSAIGGLAAGLIVLLRTKAARLTALGLYVCMSLDHAAGNTTEISNSWLVFLAWPLRALAHVQGLMPIAALAAAWWLDQRRQRNHGSFEPLLAAERTAPSHLKGALGAAFSRLPWSLVSVDRLARMRRAFRNDSAAAGAQAAALDAMVVNERDRVEQELVRLHTSSPALLPPAWTWSGLRAALRRPAVIIWLVIMTPSVLWFVIGGWPPTAGLQAFMMRPVVWTVLGPISILAQTWISWRTVAGLRTLSRTRGASIGDDAAVVGLRAACGIGAVSLGAFSLLRMLGGLAPGSSILASLHAADAANRLTPGGGSMIANGGGAFAPPPPSPDLPDPAAGNSSAASSAASSGASPGAANSNPGGARNSPPAVANKTAPSAPSPQDEAAAAQSRADAADADALAARQRRLQAQNALESSEIKQATDTGIDPALQAARDRGRSANNAADAADIAAADDFKDPWGEKSPGQTAADAARDAARAADADRTAAEQAAQQRSAEEVDAAKAAEKQADSDVAAADSQAEAARADAAAKAAAAQASGAEQAAAARSAADPQGVAAEAAAKTAADAQQQADKAFFDSSDPTGNSYRAALQNAHVARQQAEAARAAADAAKGARDTIAARDTTTGWPPDKP